MSFNILDFLDYLIVNGTKYENLLWQISRGFSLNYVDYDWFVCYMLLYQYPFKNDFVCLKF